MLCHAVHTGWWHSGKQRGADLLVQGLSKDGQFYLSADFSITHPKLPNRVQDTPKRQQGDYAPDRTLLSQQSDLSFAPALDGIRKWLKTLEAK
jgi:hypothetical protein